MNRDYIQSILEKLVLMLLISLAFAVAAFAKGGDMVAPYPLIDSVALKQEAKAMAVDHSGNIITAGCSNAGGMNNNYQVVKFMADGSGVAWRASFDKDGGDDQATAVAVDGADNVIVTGTVWNSSNTDIHTVKYSGVDGSVLWQHTWSGAAAAADIATSIAVDGANNIYVAGYTANSAGNDDYLVLKYPSAGSTPLWEEIYNSSFNSNDRIISIAAGSDGVAVTGVSSKGGTDFDILTRKYAFDGSLIWAQRKASASGGDDRGRAVKMDYAGNVIVSGYLYNGQNNDIYTVKYAAASPGTTLWEKSFAGGGNDEPLALWIDSNGEIYLTGHTYTYSGNEDFYTVRYSAADGTKIWDRLYDSGSDFTDIATSIVGSAGIDGAVFVTGYTSTDINENFTTLKYKKNSGELVWQKSYSSSAGKNARPVGIGLQPSGNPVVAGWTDTAADSYDFVVVSYDYGKLDPPTGLTSAATSNSSIALNWLDNSANETGFKIERKLGESGTYAEIATVAENIATFSDSDLVPNSYYYYRVRAYNSSEGDSYYSNEAHALTKVVSYDPPAWIYQYNGTDNREDEAVGIVVGSDNHPIVTGYSDLTEEGVEGAYSFDYMTIKLDRANKAIKWKALYDSGDGGTDMTAGIALDNNGDAVVTGTAYLSGGSDKSDDLYTIKYSSAGHADPLNGPPTAWGEQYGTQSGIDQATAIQAAKDSSNNIVVIGHGINTSSDEDMFIIKYRPDGSTPWTPIVYNGPANGNDYPSAVAFDQAGNIFITGSTENSAGNFDIYTAKYSGATGALIWAEIYAGAGNGHDHGLSLAVDKNGDIYITGSSINAAGNEEWVTIKYDGADSSSEREIWREVYNGPAVPGNGNDQGIALALDPIDGAVVVAGTSYTTLTDSDFHLIRYSAADGSIIWGRNFDRPTRYDYLTAMTIDSSGYIYLAGNSRNGPDTDAGFDSTADVLAVIYDFEGTFLSATEYDGGRMDEARAIAVNYQGEAFIAGVTLNAVNPDYLVVKQKNDYILVPAPLLPLPESDSSRMNVTWQDNTSGTSFRVEKTAAPILPDSIWTVLTTAVPGTTSFMDTGLSAGTNYCYRIYAFSGSLNSRTVVKCATTTLGATALSPLTVDSTTQITLGWSQVDGNSGYRVERKTGSGGSWSDLAVKAAGITTHIDSGLTPGTIYYYRVSTISAAGYSLPSNEQSAPTLPNAPEINSFATVTVSSLVLGWANVAGESGYRIERKEEVAGTWAEIATRSADVVSFTDSGLSANTRYNYRLRAYNASGNSAYSSVQTTRTKFVSPALSSAAGSATDKIDLSWSNVPGNTGYTIQYVTCYYTDAANAATQCPNTANYSSSWTFLTTVAADVTTYQAVSLSAGNAYQYRVIANTADNTSDPSNAILAWTHMVPPVVTITPASESSLTVSWPDIVGETHYTLEGKLGAGGPWIELSGAIDMPANTTSKTDTGLELSTEYCYRVKAKSINPNGPPSVYSNEPCLFTPLPAPTLNALSATATQVDLSWNNIAGNSGYELQRCEFYDPDNQQNAAAYLNSETPYWTTCSTISPLAVNTISYQDSGRREGYTYRYRVRDTYSGGVSAWSNAQWITTIPAGSMINSLTAVSTNQINVSWANFSGESSFNLQWKVRSSEDCLAGDWSAPVVMGQNSTSYSHSGLAAGTFYCYRIAAANVTGSSPYSPALSQTTLAVAPVLGDLSGVMIAEVSLAWNNVTGNSGYKIERKTTAIGGWGTIHTTAADVTSYTDTGLTAGTLYYYRVSTNNAAGSSAASNEQSATTTPVAPVVAAIAFSDDRIDLSWPVVLGATNYKIERKEGTGNYSEFINLPVDYAENYCGNSFPTIGCPSLTPVKAAYQNTGLTENTAYCYRLLAWNSTGRDSAYSTEKCATALPIADQTLFATSLNSFKIRLDWVQKVCAPNPCDPPEGYEIERMVRDGNWVRIGTEGAGVTTFTDRRAIDPNRQYRYRVRSYSGESRSPYSAEAVVYTPPYTSGDNVGP